MWASTKKSRSTVTNTPSSYISAAPLRYGFLIVRSGPINNPALTDTMLTPLSIANAHAVFSASVFDNACHSYPFSSKVKFSIIAQVKSERISICISKKLLSMLLCMILQVRFEKNIVCVFLFFEINKLLSIYLDMLHQSNLC